MQVKTINMQVMAIPANADSHLPTLITGRGFPLCAVKVAIRALPSRAKLNNNRLVSKRRLMVTETMKMRVEYRAISTVEMSEAGGGMV